MQETIVIIQARMTSSRLPGKILKNFSNGLNMLDMQINTLQNVVPKNNIYIATTKNEADDVIEQRYQGICNIFRGDENDVLSRFLSIIKSTNAKDVIRISSDNPFIFSEGINYLLACHIKNRSDYTTFNIENIPSMLVPIGLFVEIISANALLDIKAKVNDIEKEHVTFALYNRLKNQYRVNLISIVNIYPVLNNKDLRFTVDTTEDFDFIDSIINKLDINIIDLLIIEKIVSYIKNKDFINNMILESNKIRNSKKYE